MELDHDMLAKACIGESIDMKRVAKGLSMQQVLDHFIRHDSGCVIPPNPECSEIVYKLDTMEPVDFLRQRWSEYICHPLLSLRQIHLYEWRSFDRIQSHIGEIVRCTRETVKDACSISCRESVSYPLNMDEREYIHNRFIYLFVKSAVRSLYKQRFCLPENNDIQRYDRHDRESLLCADLYKQSTCTANKLMQLIFQEEEVSKPKLQ